MAKWRISENTIEVVSQSKEGKAEPGGGGQETLGRRGGEGAGCCPPSRAVLASIGQVLS